MFFVLSKVLGFFSLPSNFIAVVCVIGAVLWLLKRRRAGARMLLLGTALLLLFGYSPLSNILMLSLSERFPPWQFDGHDPDGIIVLGGGILSEVSAARDSVELGAAGDRILAMLQLARRFPKARIVFSGGSAMLLEQPVPEAPIAGRLLQQFGLDGGRVILDAASRTTSENARFVRKLVDPKSGERWLLVTSAFHMPRSVGVFRAEGFDVEAYPVDWRTRGWVDAANPFDKLSAGLTQSDFAVKEWVGLLSYWLSGRSSTLFPAPQPK
jgi:uncharacterized SAM-binding protein YcdF (DUF218 family)